MQGPGGTYSADSVRIGYRQTTDLQHEYNRATVQCPGSSLQQPGTRASSCLRPAGIGGKKSPKDGLHMQAVVPVVSRVCVGSST